MFLVFDVGGTFTKYAWMTAQGEIAEKGKLRAKNREGEGVSEFVDSLVEIYDKYKTQGELEGIAMGLPGQVDVENGIVYGGGALKYLDNIPLGSLLSKRCDGIRVSLENDGKCAALAELWKGNAGDCRNACVLVFGTGIGGGIILDRKVHRGNHLLAGEVSFCFDNVRREDLEHFELMESIENVDESYVRLPYTWSTINSTKAFVNRVAYAKGLSSEEVSGELIYRWADEGDTLVISMLEDYYFDIAKYCCNLYVILDLDIILIGGGISAQPAFVEGIKRYADKLKTISVIYKDIKIDVCRHRNDSNLLGALYNFKQKYNLL